MKQNPVTIILMIVILIILMTVNMIRMANIRQIITISHAYDYENIRFLNHLVH